MISVDEARQIIISTYRSKPIALKTERVTLECALDRVLARDLFADTDQPPFNRSIKDGYAVRSIDIQKAPVALKVVGESRAGDAKLPDVGKGEAVQIMTGAALPAGADAVVMVEETERIAGAAAAERRDSFDATVIRIHKSVSAGANISLRGSEARAGETLLKKGARIRVHEISLAAGVGSTGLDVFSKPRVAIIATGDELVEIGKIPAQNQIRNSNSYSLAAMVQQAHARPELMGLARDDSADLREKIGTALAGSDCILVTGGVSAGKYDFVEPVLRGLGITFHFDAVAIRPGKPAVFGSRGQQFVFGLPGNPVSAVVTFHLLVRPLLALLSGEEPCAPRILNARLENSFRQPLGRRGFLPGYYEICDGEVSVRTVRWRGSSDLVGLARSNCFLVAPEGQEEFQAGSVVQMMLVD